MKLDGDKIVIESRHEIEDIINMINIYQKSNEKKNYVTNKSLDRLKDKLEVLEMTW